MAGCRHLSTQIVWILFCAYSQSIGSSPHLGGGWRWRHDRTTAFLLDDWSSVGPHDMALPACTPDPLMLCAKSWTTFCVHYILTCSKMVLISSMAAHRRFHSKICIQCPPRTKVGSFLWNKLGVWDNFYPKKGQVLFWILCHRKIQTHAFLHHMNYMNDPNCSFWAVHQNLWITCSVPVVLFYSHQHMAPDFFPLTSASMPLRTLSLPLNVSLLISHLGRRTLLFFWIVWLKEPKQDWVLDPYDCWWHTELWAWHSGLLISPLLTHTWDNSLLLMRLVSCRASLVWLLYLLFLAMFLWHLAACVKLI